MMLKQPPAISALTLTLTLALAASLVSTPSLAANKVLVGGFDVGPGGLAQKFNPLTATAGFTWFNKYFGTLALYDEKFQKISGDLAQGWQVSPDGKTVTIALRTDVKWHDGKPFTSRDVKFTLDLVRNPELGSAFATRLEGLSSITTPDAKTVVLNLQVPNSPIFDALTSLMIVPEHQLGTMKPQDLRNAEWWKNSPVGTGPFKWGKYLPDQYVELDANPDFYRKKPKLDKLVNRYFKDGAAAAIALRAGEIQFTYLTLDQVPDITARQNARVVEGSSQVLNYLGFNNTEPRFKDVRVRQAMMMAIDRAGIVRSLYGGRAQLASCVYSQPQYVPNDVNPYGHDPARARLLLAEAGWDRIKGEPIELLTYYGDQLSKDVVSTLQAQLAAVGVDVKPRFVDGPTYGQIADSGKFTLVLAGAGNGPEPDSISPLMDSGDQPPRGVNRMRVAMPELDRLFDQGRKESDVARREAIYKDVCRLTNARLPWGPLWVANRFGGIGQKVQGMVWWPAPGGGRYQDHAENWDIAP
jgi:peptide/nickel transport system substrate-binding protein